MHEQITSAQNPRLKLIKKLRDKRGREQEQRFVIDDWRDLARALQCGYILETLLYCESIAGNRHEQFVDQAHGVYVLSEELIQKASYRENAAGIIAILQQKPRLGIADLIQTETGPLLGLVDLRKPGNIGALLRSADATGFATILLIDTTLDLYNPNIIRSSTGTCFLGNIYYLSSEDALVYLNTHHYTILSAHLSGDKTLYEIDISKQTAILLGTEDQGLSEFWVDHCTHLIKIPMMGHVADSLNVSVSGAVIMYEALRQRSYPTRSTC